MKSGSQKHLRIPNLSLSNNQLDYVEQYNYLGIELDQELKCDELYMYQIKEG